MRRDYFSDGFEDRDSKSITGLLHNRADEGPNMSLCSVFLDKRGCAVSEREQEDTMMLEKTWVFEKA